jgi:hypothetical protein
VTAVKQVMPNVLYAPDEPAAGAAGALLARPEMLPNSGKCLIRKSCAGPRLVGDRVEGLQS